jgi:hypothetical protein
MKLEMRSIVETVKMKTMRLSKLGMWSKFVDRPDRGKISIINFVLL